MEIIQICNYSLNPSQEEVLEVDGSHFLKLLKEAKESKKAYQIRVFEVLDGSSNLGPLVATLPLEDVTITMPLEELNAVLSNKSGFSLKKWLHEVRRINPRHIIKYFPWLKNNQALLFDLEEAIQGVQRRKSGFSAKVEILRLILDANWAFLWIYLRRNPNRPV